MSDGWIKLWRKSLESQVWTDTNLWKIWSWCLLRANHKETWVSVQTGIGFQSVKLLPGQFIFGRHEASKELKMPASSVRNRMQKLKDMGNVDMQPDTHFSIVSIINWESYQSDNGIGGQATGEAQDRHRTGTGQALDTDKNVKNVKNVKNKEIYGTFQNVKLTKEEYQKLEEQFNEDGTKERIENISLYLSSKGDKYKSHYATILAWEKNRKGSEVKKYGVID